VNARLSAGAYGASLPQLILSKVGAFTSTKRCNTPRASLGVIFGALRSMWIDFKPVPSDCEIIRKLQQPILGEVSSANREIFDL
jgi:hypothetical protein